jgi:hypothetical protein
MQRDSFERHLVQQPHPGHEATKSTKTNENSSSWLRVFVAIDVTVYPECFSK